MLESEIVMKDFLICYSSKTGNTAKVARAMYDAAPERCDIFKADEMPSVEGYKVLFVGYWLDKGVPDKKAQEFIATIGQNKRIVFFQTLGAEPLSAHALAAFANAGKLLDTSCQVIGALSIRGAIDPNLIKAMMKLPPENPHAPNDESKARWAAASTHPDDNDLAETKTYMEKTIALCDKYMK